VSLPCIELAPLTTPHNALQVGDRRGPVETLSEGLFDECSWSGMVTTGASVYFLQQLTALISGDTPHEYVGRPALVELAVDKDEGFGPSSATPGFRLVRGELPLE
jgi:hypothetical protein